MNQARILSRLGLRESSYGRKRFVGETIQHFLNVSSLWQNKARNCLECGRNHDSDEFERYRRQTDELLTSLRHLKGTLKPKQHDVLEVVNCVATFMNKVPLKNLLDHIEDQDMQANSRAKLVDTLEKIARYRNGAVFLCQRAKRFPPLRRTSVELVQPPSSDFRTIPKCVFAGTVESALRDLHHGDIGFELIALPDWVLQRLRPTSEDDFAEQINETLQQSKIHAEIQILAHYERAGPEVLPPRIIASSKDACYLCNACIRLHGKFCVPKSHDRLYTSWRLPTTQQFLPLQRSLNDFLEQEIVSTTEIFCRLAKKPKVRFSNESTLFPIHISTSTLMKFSNMSSLDLASQLSNNGRLPKAGQVLAETGLSRPSPTLEHRQQPCEAVKAHSETSSQGHRGTSEEAPHHDPKPSKPCMDSPAAIAGIRTRFRHKNMEIFLESTAGLVPEWLDSAGSADLLRHRHDLVVDVLKMLAGGDARVLPRNEDDNAFFAFGENVVVMKPCT